MVGAVHRPGLYRVPTGSRVADAVSQAGGLTRRADPAGVNLAAPVADGEQLVVPARLPVAVAAAQGAPVGGVGSAAPAGPVQLSVATAEQLDSLPGVGPVTAEKIVDYRTAHGAFRSVDELDEVPGIGPSAGGAAAWAGGAMSVARQRLAPRGGNHVSPTDPLLSEAEVYGGTSRFPHAPSPRS